MWRDAATGRRALYGTKCMKRNCLRMIHHGRIAMTRLLAQGGINLPPHRLRGQHERQPSMCCSRDESYTALRRNTFRVTYQVPIDKAETRKKGTKCSTDNDNCISISIPVLGNQCFSKSLPPRYCIRFPGCHATDAPHLRRYSPAVHNEQTERRCRTRTQKE